MTIGAMQTRASSSADLQWSFARAGVLSTPVALTGVQLGRIAIFGSARDVVIAAGLSIATVGPHIWHLRHALRNRPAPHAAAMFTIMIAATVTGLALLGPVWVYLLAILATSALIVLPMMGAGVTFVACLVLALVAPDLHFGVDLQGSGYAQSWFTTSSFVFQFVLLSAVVWLLAAVDELETARPALVTARLRRERARLTGEIDSALARLLKQVVRLAESAAAAPSHDHVSAVVSASDRTLARMREEVARLRPVADVAAPVGPVRRLIDDRVERWARVIAFIGGSVVFVFPIIRLVDSFGVSATAVWSVLSWALCAAIAGVVWYRYAVGQILLDARDLLFLGASVGGYIGGLLLFGAPWNVVSWFALTVSIMVLRGAARVAFATIGLGFVIVVEVVGYYTSPEQVIYDVFYTAVLISEAVAGLVACAALVRVVAAVIVSRDTLAECAADDERLRISTGLHDILGQSLTAISLKGDLARRLADRDPTRAAGELSDIVTIARRQRDELAAVVDDERPVNLSVEIEAARELLSDAGVDVVMDVDPRALGDEFDTTLCAWAVREAATNIVRHAHARRATITFHIVDGAYLVEVSNDGPSRAGNGDVGTGLAGLARRVEAEKGCLDATPIEPEGFRMRLELPRTRVPA